MDGAGSPLPAVGFASGHERRFPGETTEGPRCVSHVDRINMGDTPGHHRAHTVA